MKTIKLGEIGDYSEEQVNALLSVVILTADRIVKEGTPVDTGRLYLHRGKAGDPCEQDPCARELESRDADRRTKGWAFSLRFQGSG